MTDESKEQIKRLLADEPLDDPAYDEDDDDLLVEDEDIEDESDLGDNFDEPVEDDQE